MLAKERRLARFTVPASLLTKERSCDETLKVTDDDLSLLAHEFPCVNPYFHGSEHRFVYGCSFPYLPKSALYKYDIETKTHLVWDGGPDLIPSEPVFVPDPKFSPLIQAVVERSDQSWEDRGVVLAVVNISSNDSSFLLVLDATDFRELARVQTPIVINHGIHSVFIPPRACQPQVARY